MTALPTELPDWYGFREKKPDSADGNNPKKDNIDVWTPQTEDIAELQTSKNSNDKQKNNRIRNAWNGTSFAASSSNSHTVGLQGLQILTPIQVGGSQFSKEGIEPAQLGGVPCIPGSSWRGALLQWIRMRLNSSSMPDLPFDCALSPLSDPEKQFWLGLLEDDRQGWKPRAIRFETTMLPGKLQPFPLNPQQDWQLFYRKENKLSVQWQFPAPDDPSKASGDVSVRVWLRHPPTSQQQAWVKQELLAMLKCQGIGRGKASGFGRVVDSIPEQPQWTIELDGMKPGVQAHKANRQEGKYHRISQTPGVRLPSHRANPKRTVVEIATPVSLAKLSRPFRRRRRLGRRRDRSRLLESSNSTLTRRILPTSSLQPNLGNAPPRRRIATATPPSRSRTTQPQPRPNCQLASQSPQRLEKHHRMDSGMARRCGSHGRMAFRRTISSAKLALVEMAPRPHPDRTLPTRHRPSRHRTKQPHNRTSPHARPVHLI